MCGSAGLAVTFGFSIFGVIFLSILAGLISRGYPYVGEWFETTDGKPLSEQQEEVSKALWNAVLIYIVIGGIAALGLCFHRVKNKMF